MRDISSEQELKAGMLESFKQLPPTLNYMHYSTGRLGLGMECMRRHESRPANETGKASSAPGTNDDEEGLTAVL